MMYAITFVACAAIAAWMIYKGYHWHDADLVDEDDEATDQ